MYKTINSKLKYIIFFLLCITQYAITQTKSDEDVSIFTRLKLQVFEDDKPKELYIVGDLTLSTEKGYTRVFWKDVWISTVESQKKMLLKPEFNSSDDGTISNVILKDNHFSFDLFLEPERIMKVSGTKMKYRSEYEVNGVGSFWVEMLNKHVKTEWRTITKPIILPYNELF
jgi:hypothetical protein